jgi:hypothetical protein
MTNSEKTVGGEPVRGPATRGGNDPGPQILRDLEKAVRDGGSLKQFMAQFAGSGPEPLPEKLLRRAALVRSIDNSLYEQVLLTGIKGPAFEDFRGYPELHGAGRQTCILGETERRKHLSYWQEHLPECREFSARLEEFYRPSAPFDSFLHSLFARPETARARFLEAYSELDREMALSGCETMLRVLTERLLILPSDLREAVNEREQYLRSRTLFADDYYRTVVHVTREVAAREFEAFLANGTEWILHLHGSGGVGKTAFLRWLIARRCIPDHHGGTRIPVARIDVDAFDRRGLGEYPELAFLPLMKQLTQQLPRNPFQSYLLSLSDCEAMLSRPSSREGEGFRADLKSKIRTQGTFIAHLPKAFASAVGAQPMLVVLDTIEDMLLHQRAQLLEILQLFAGVRAQCHGFRLVVSGRYDLAENNRLPEFVSLYPGQVRTLLFSDFTQEETTRYLTQSRKIAQPDIVLAIWNKTRGHPFDVTLLADIVVADAKITARQIRHLPPQYARLIERIIDRIPDEQRTLRWLLRYAVVPRRLDLDYVLQVINKPIRREAKGTSIRDNTKRFPDPHAERRYSREERWKPLDDVELTNAWNQLLSYAAQTSWVTEEAGMVRLQPEIVEPMRALLRLNPIYEELHTQSQRHFESLARSRPDDWGQWIAEAVYHRLQRNVRGGGAYWVKQLRRARRRGYSDLEAVAGVVFGPEFLDEKKRPSLKVSRAAIARASYDLAYVALVRLLRLPNRHPDFPRLSAQLEQRWKDLRFYSGGAGRGGVTIGQRALIRAAHLSFNSGIGGASRYYATSLKLALLASRRISDGAGKLAAEMLIATRFHWLNLREAKPHFDEARRISSRTRSRDLPVALIDLLLARNYLYVDNLHGAAKHFLKSWQNIDGAEGALEPAVVFRRAAETLYEAGDWDEATLLQQRASALTDGKVCSGVHFQWLHAEARMRLKLGDFIAGRARCTEAEAAAQGPQEQAVQMELSAEFEAARYRLDEAKALFAQAEYLYSQAGSPMGVPSCRLKTARMYLEQAGDANRCREILTSAGHLFPSPSLRLEAMRIEVLASARIDPAVAAVRWRKNLAKLGEEDFSPRARASFLVPGLALGLGREPELKQLWPLLARIRPLSAVYGVLQDFELHQQAAWAADTRHRLLSYAPALKRRDPGSILRCIAYANACHFFGQSQEAARQLLRCLNASEAFPDLVPKIRATLFRVSPTQYQLRAIPDAETLVKAEGADPYRLRWIEEAERTLELRDTASARAWLQLCPTGTWPAALVRSQWGVRAGILSAALANLRGSEARNQLLQAGDIARDLAYLLPDWAAGALREIGTRSLSEDELAPKSTRVEIEGVTPLQAAVKWSTADTRFKGSVNVVLPSPEQADPVLNPFPDAGFAAGILQNSADAPVQLCVRHKELEGFPWEAAFPLDRLIYRAASSHLRFNQTIRCMQKSLVLAGNKLKVDGILGPTTSAALRRLDTDDPNGLRAKLMAAGPPVGKVLIVQPDLEEERFLKRGHGWEAIHVVKLYAQCGLQAREHVYRDIASLKTEIERVQPAIVHVITGFWQTRSGDILPDIARLHTEPLSPGVLETLVGGGREGGTAVTIIIECVTPPSSFELRLQGSARNRYCADLFAAGDLKGVLATGLWQFGLTGTYLSGLIKALAQPASLGDVFVQAPRSELWPPALFTSDPLLPVWER